jgi:oligosaccharyltransferase complex subunit beta
MRSLLSLVLFLFAALVSAVSTAGNRLLVVLDSPKDKEAYTTFFHDLSGIYPQLTIVLISKLTVDRTRLRDHI